MSAPGVDKKRRRILVAATSVVGAVGVGYVAVPFIASMNPSAKARAAGAPVEADTVSYTHLTLPTNREV